MKSQLLGRFTAVVIAAGMPCVAGCATPYAYRPAEMADATSDGQLAARYPVPPESPRGTVYVTSFGVTKVDVRPGQRADLLHVRIAASNDNDAAPWSLDTQQQLLYLPGQAPLRPAYVNTDIAGGPVAAIPRGQKHVVDLYYMLPPPLREAKQLPHFEVLWQVQSGARVVAQRTPFERMEAPPEGVAGPYPPYVAVGLGWGPYWWYDPLFPPALSPLVLGYYYPWGARPYYHSYYSAHGVGRGPAPSSGWRGSPPSSGWRGSPPSSFHGRPGHR